MKSCHYLHAEDEIAQSCREFLATLKCQEATCNYIANLLDSLLLIFNKHKIKIASEISPEMIEDFFKLKYSQRRKKSNPLSSNIVIYVRQYLMFLYRKKLLNFNPEIFQLTSAHPPQNAPVCFSDQEIQSLFSVIDRETTKGKRDLAILTIALHTGLRCGDIIGLSFENIFWERMEIHVVQGKTGKPISLPMDTEVAVTLSDYILHGRPHTDDRHLFVRIQKPYRQLQAVGCGNNILHGYFKKAGIEYSAFDGKRFHALRRTLASNMLFNEIPLTTIS